MYRDPIGHRIKILSNLMKRNMDVFFDERSNRATLMQIWIIGYLQDQEDKHKETFQKDIEAEFSINRSTTSEMLKLMCKKGMIQRVPVSYDGRLKKIVLTDQSREFNKKIEEHMHFLHDNLVRGLSEEEKQTFVSISDKLINNMKNI